MTSQDKIQAMLTQHLLEKGHIKFQLPDGMDVELGIVQENKKGNLEITKNYSWIIAKQKERVVAMDSYNACLECTEEGSIVFDDLEKGYYRNLQVA